MSETSYKVANQLYFVRQVVSTAKTTAKPVEVSTNHLVLIDCSGSMYGELPQIRTQLKRKLPKLIGEKDTLSIIWFSGRGQFGTLLEAEPVATLTDLQQVNQAIDRWLKPICLTGFKEPLEEVSRVIGRIAAKRPDSAFSLFFMSDGCDNCSNRAEILKTVEALSGKLASATFVEYGYYADRPLLTAMAEKAGGNLIFSQSFDTYAPLFETAMQKKPMGGKKIEITIPGDPVGGFVFAMDSGDLLTFAVEQGSVSVPAGISEVWYVSTAYVSKTAQKGQDLLASFKDAGDPNKDNSDLVALPATYAAMSLFSVRMLPDVVLPFLKVTGDVAFIERFSGLFGKQKYSEFMDAAKEAAFDPTKRLTKGYNPSLVPPDDAFTVLDLLWLLASDPGNELLLDHPEFKYQKIGRAQVDAGANLTKEEQAEVAQLRADMEADPKNAKKIAAYANRITEIAESKPEALKFVEDKAAKAQGYSIAHLTYNEERPNISVLVRKGGWVDLSKRLADGEHPKVPRAFPTFVFRNYAIVKDGLINVMKLPVNLTNATYNLIKDKVDHVVEASGASVTAVLDLARLPIINRKMVQSVSAKTLFKKEYELTKLRAAQKVYNTVKKEKFPRTSEGYEILYSKEAATWLKEQGFTDYSGFGPKTVQDEAKDFYMTRELVIGIKGLSSLPSMNEFKKQAAKNKLTAGAQLMAPAVKDIEDFLASPVYVKAKDPDKLFEAWLDGQFKTTQADVRKLIAEMAQIKFSIIVGQVWPFPTIDENTLEITVSGQKLLCTLTAREAKVEI